jgi:hypothetical protein
VRRKVGSGAVSDPQGHCGSLIVVMVGIGLMPTWMVTGSPAGKHLLGLRPPTPLILAAPLRPVIAAHTVRRAHRSVSAQSPLWETKLDATGRIHSS